jgi:hypothetical protein
MTASYSPAQLVTTCSQVPNSYCHDLSLAFAVTWEAARHEHHHGQQQAQEKLLHSPCWAAHAC